MVPDNFDTEFAALHAETRRLLQDKPFDAMLTSRHRLALLDLAHRADAAGEMKISALARLDVSDIWSVLASRSQRY